MYKILKDCEIVFHCSPVQLKAGTEHKIPSHIVDHLLNDGFISNKTIETKVKEVVTEVITEVITSVKPVITPKPKGRK